MDNRIPYALGFIFGLTILTLLICIPLMVVLQLGVFNMGKPVIYLYPTQPGYIGVNLVTDGVITVSDPPYQNGWHVWATPQSLIDGKYDYLFYEADVDKGADLSLGWIVDGPDIEPWLDENLIRFGLNQREKDDFMEYWMEHLPVANYYKVVLITDEDLDEMVALDIDPKPDTVIRVNLYIKPLDEKSEIEPQIIKDRIRNGFTVVEWGVILDG